MVGIANLGKLALLHPLQHRAFRFLFAGQVVSNLGDWLDSLAVVILVVYQWRLGVGELAALTLAWMVPGAVLGPITGVYGDRWPKRPTMIACDVTRAALVLGLVWAPSLPVVVGLQVAKASLSSLFGPSRQAAVRATLPDDDLLAASALGRFSTNATKVLGPALGGLLVAAVGPRPVFALDALSFLVSAACLAQLPGLDAPLSSDPLPGARFWHELRAGFSFILAAPLLRIAVLAIMAEMVIVEINDTLSVLAFRELGMNEALVGLALGGSGLGNVLATLAIGQWGRSARPLAVMGGGMLVVGATEAVIGNALVLGLHGSGTPWLPVLVCIGAGFAAIWVPYAYVLQRETPHALMARVSASADGLANVCGLVGPLLGAALATSVGLGPVFGGTGVALAVLGITLWLAQAGHPSTHFVPM